MLLAALATALCLLSAPPAAADGPGAQAIDLMCEAASGPIAGAIADALTGEDVCDKIGDKTAKALSPAWDSVWKSVLGDVIKSGKDVAVWILRTTLTVALQGPSLRLEATGLFGKDATLAGIMMWLGWVIAAFGLMWQLGKMAVTGQMKYAGQALVGWVQNALLTGAGLTIIATLLQLGDELTQGLVDATFKDPGQAVERAVAVMLPVAIQNPGIVAGVVIGLVLIGFVQLVMIFLRESAIPIQCMLLPIAGAGRVGGEVTRQWAPKLITSILVIIAYKPILAIILCIGFAQFGHSQTLSEWLRGFATLFLGVVAPAPLTKIFAPLGAEVGAGLSAGGALGAASNIADLVGSGRDGGGGGGGDGQGTDAVTQAQHVEQSMGPQQGAQSPPEGKVPRQAESPDVGSRDVKGKVVADGVKTEAGAAAGGPVTLGLEVLDGINNTIQKGSDEMGGGDKS
ncbi:hypothetical protein [Streptomyces sp.]|uniref:hypothetical protein n=1 Tax=Streptomyces sp. TaxID=1931 RepID=UPI002F92F7C2